MSDIGARPARLLRALMERAGSVLNLDYSEQMLSPGTSDDDRAYLLFSRGAELLLNLEHDVYFPALSPRVKKRGARQIRKAFGTKRGETAASFLAQALATFVGCLRRDEVERQAALGGLVQSAFPISERDARVLVRCQGEFKVMETHELRPDFTFGVEVGTGYHLALADGEDPDADQDLVAIQRRYAVEYFALEAEHHAIAVAADSNFRRVEPHLLRAGQSDYDALPLYEMRVQAWTGEVPYWDNYASSIPVPWPEVAEAIGGD